MDDNSLDGFGDIVTNFLGILIVVLILMPVSATTTDTTRPLRPALDEPLAIFGATLRGILHPFTDHYFVSGGKVVAIDWRPLAQSVADARLAGSLASEDLPLLGPGQPLVRVTSQFAVPAQKADSIAASLSSDLDVYEFLLTFPVLGLEGPTDVLAGEQIFAKMAGGMRSANFIVSNDSFARFAALYRQLTERQLCFRWVEYVGGTRHAFYRSQFQYSEYSGRKCQSRR